jgi:hypothetical protein
MRNLDIIKNQQTLDVCSQNRPLTTLVRQPTRRLIAQADNEDQGLVIPGMEGLGKFGAIRDIPNWCRTHEKTQLLHAGKILANPVNPRRTRLSSQTR